MLVCGIVAPACVVCKWQCNFIPHVSSTFLFIVGDDCAKKLIKNIKNATYNLLNFYFFMGIKPLKYL